MFEIGFQFTMNKSQKKLKLIPTWNQFLNWSMPSQVTYIAGWLAVVGLLWAFVSPFFLPNLNNELLARYEETIRTEYECRIQNSIMKNKLLAFKAENAQLKSKLSTCSGELSRFVRKAAEFVSENSLSLEEKAHALYLLGKYDKAIEWYERAAGQGHVSAQYNLGIIYQYTKSNFKLAITWYERAARQGHVSAQYSLGTMYDFLSGSDYPDCGKAIKWYKKAAEQGHLDAKERIEYIEENMNDFGDLKKKAAQGDVNAQCEIGCIYQNSCGGGFYFSQDLGLANKWHRRAAEKGFAHAQYYLGRTYYDSKNYKEALFWFRKSAKQGHLDSQYQLGVMYHYSQGVKYDFNIALKYYNKTAEAGHLKAKQILRLME